jgi:hypothetical protein
MTGTEILSDKWTEAFQSFTNAHSGSLVTVGMEGRNTKHQLGEVEGRELPLRNVVTSAANRQNTVTITIGGRGDDLLTHEVRAVSAIRLAPSGNTSGAILYIEAKNGQVTTITVSTPTKATG